MDSNDGIASLPWYRSLNREQWRVLVASNLGWLFDGFEIYALFLTVGFALHQLLEAAQYTEIPRYAGFRMGDGRCHRRHRRRLYRPQANDDAGDPRLFADHGTQRHRLGLAIVRNPALSRRRGDRLGMGDRSLARLRIMARPCARQGRGTAAERRRYR